ncbi:MAG: type II toxin-antitoxin system RelE/ParE family toxin [Bacteroidetes bacterium]|nr:MAG: type II toxin-antitoxin system RelE/ParE family toxin [Bacteroidota bacterium]
MAKEIIWSTRAQEDRKGILSSWTHHNKSNTYSIKLNQLFVSAIKLIGKFPRIGRQTDYGNVRFKVVKDYFIIYEETRTTVNILTIWDCKQDPEKLNKILSDK